MKDFGNIDPFNYPLTEADSFQPLAAEYLEVDSIPVALQDAVYVTVEREYDNLVDLGGFEVEVDASYEPMQHIAERGTVASVPRRLGEYYTRRGIPMDVCVGDLVHFHYHAIDPHNLLVVDGRKYYRVEYDQLYYAKREERIVMLNDFMLAEPVMERPETTASGIVLSAFGEERPVPLQAYVRHIPDRFQEVYSELLPMRRFFFAMDSDLEISVDGKTLYIMNIHSDVIGVY